MLALVAGCSTGKPTKEGIFCFPADAAKWIHVKESSTKMAVKPAILPVKASTATIYVDRSASMIGYLKGADQFNKPLQDLLGNLPVVIRQAGAEPSFRGFGRTISDPVADGGSAFQNIGTYSCAKRDASCESAESHLDQVLMAIAGNKNDMAVVLSDLWYDNSDEQTSGMTALQEPLTRILQDGRAVMLYGIEAPFDGEIYDLPSGPKEQVSARYKGKHPLFMLAIGSKADVLEFDRKLADSGSKGISDGLASNAIRRSLFTVDPGPLTPALEEPLTKVSHPRLNPTPFETFGTVSIQQYSLKPGLPSRPGSKVEAKPQWIAPKDSDFLPNAVWRGQLAGTVSVYQRKDNMCTPASWLKLNPLVERQAIADTDNGQFIFDLDPGNLSGRMATRGVYMVSGYIERTSVNSPNEANAWMREWSLQPELAANVARRPGPLFPTLNLSEVARIMENALATAAERNGGGIVGFSVLVRSGE